MHLIHVSRTSQFLVFLLPVAFAASREASPTLRLDTSAVPTHYSAQLTVKPNTDTFEGAIDIEVKINQARRVIWLNALELEFKSAQIGGETAKIVAGNKGFTGLEVDNAIAAGPAKIHIDYTGKISRNASSGVFQLPDGEHWYVYTQFESTDARRAFPCFDQPEFKTPWDIALRVPSDQKAFANTPEVSSTVLDARSKLVKFATTRPLPSYLVAFAVGPFDVVDAGRAGAGHTPLRIVMPQGHAGQAKFAADSLSQLLQLLEEYFGMPFPYPKLDSVVMPLSNFAMENAGLITYGADVLLSDAKRDTITRQRMCAIISAHEMSHQWFGDLVTTAWWDDIWLNEAFATWMENKIVESWRPGWHMDVEAAEEMLGVMHQDRLASTRTIRQPIESENDIANAFDGITYQKGAAVISMFEHWIGPEKFRNGVRLYIRENADKAATAPQFLAALSKGAGRDVAPAFSSFLEQAGTPVVNVSLTCGKGAPQVSLRQSRYLPIGSKATSSQTWSIPVCLRYGVNGKIETDCTLFTQSTGEMTLARAKSCPAWVLGNDREQGYYRVSYGGDLLAHLTANAAGELTPAEKVGFLSDVRALVDSGEVSPAAALAMVPGFANQPQRQVVTETMELAALGIGKFVDDQAVGLGRGFIRSNYAARAKQLGWRASANESDDTKLLRTTLVPFVANGGRDPVLVEEAGRLARAWLKDHAAVDPDMAGAVLVNAARFGDASLFEVYVAAAKAAKDSRERRTILHGLGSFSDPALVDRAMGLLLTKTFDLREAFHQLLFAPLDQRSTERLPFRFVRQHINELLKVLPGEVGSDLAAQLPIVGHAFCDATSRTEFEAFFRDRVKSFVGGPRELAQSLERIDLCIQQRSRLGPEIEAYLRAHSGANQ